MNMVFRLYVTTTNETIKIFDDPEKAYKELDVLETTDKMNDVYEDGFYKVQILFSYD